MVAFTTRMPAGVAGAVSRSDSLTIEQVEIDPNTPPTVYGQPVKLVSGKLQPVANGDTAFYGILVRPYPVQGVGGTPANAYAFGPGTPPTNGMADVLRRGYISVVLANGSADKGEAAFFRKTASGNLTVGMIEDNTDSGNVTALTGGIFMGPADANGITELAFNI